VRVNVLDRIKQFDKEIKIIFPELATILRYDEEDDTYIMWHNYKDWQNPVFWKQEYALLNRLLYDDGFDNFTFAFSVRVPHSKEIFDISDKIEKYTNSNSLTLFDVENNLTSYEEYLAWAV
jgi:hypothetical protein